MSSYGFWLSAAGMKVSEHRQTLHANNLANAHTTGFKQDLAVVRGRPVESRESGAARFSHPVLDGMAGGVNVMPVFTSFQQGNIEFTGRPLDVAIEGRGLFAVNNGAEVRYTRDGQFTTNVDGELVLAAGDGRWRVLSENDEPITLDPNAGPVEIGSDGIVRQDGSVLGQVGLREADEPEALVKAGANLFRAEGAVMRPVSGKLRPESREESNYDVMTGLASMIEASRAYQLNATMIQLQDQITGQATNNVGRLS